MTRAESGRVGGAPPPLLLGGQRGTVPVRGRDTSGTERDAALSSPNTDLDLDFSPLDYFF